MRTSPFWKTVCILGPFLGGGLILFLYFTVVYLSFCQNNVPQELSSLADCHYAKDKNLAFNYSSHFELWNGNDCAALTTKHDLLFPCERALKKAFNPTANVWVVMFLALLMMMLPLIFFRKTLQFFSDSETQPSLRRALIHRPVEPSVCHTLALRFQHLLEALRERFSAPTQGNDTRVELGVMPTARLQ